MKKILTLITALWVFGSMYAALIDPEQALHRVSVSAKAVPGLTGKVSPELILTGNTASGLPAYYVFANGSATIFVSADDVAIPLLGYFDSGRFDPHNIPPQMKWWLDQYAREIEWATKNGVASYRPYQAVSTMMAIEPLMKTTWNQDEPYNKFAPFLNNEQCVTGCVATAMAQVLNYYQWPKSEVPAINYTWKNRYLTSPAIILDWNNMLDSYAGNYSETQADAVARLMQIAGYSVKMDYNTSANGGSAAQTSTVRNAFVNIFGYDVAAELRYRDYYSLEEWTWLIYNELKTNGPVYYDGHGNNGGHAFVCDGYDGNGSFHFNWGWGGYCDGYFRLSALNPTGLGVGGGGGGYNFEQAALFNVSRPKIDTHAPSPYIACDGDLVGSVSGTKLYLHTLNSDNGFWNFGDFAAKFTFGVRLENMESGNVVDITSNITNKELSVWRGFSSFYVSIPTSLAGGTYKVYPLFKADSGNWELIRLKYNTPQFLIVNFSDGKLSMDDGLVITSWTSTTDFISGDAFEGELYIYNPSPNQQSITLDACLCKGTPENFEICAELGSVTKSFNGASGGSLIFSGVLPALGAGEYYLVFSENGQVKKYIAVEVYVVETIKVLSITPNPNPLVSGEKSSVEVVIQSSYQEAIEYYTYLALCAYSPAEGYYYSIFDYVDDCIAIPANSTQSFVFSGTLPADLPDSEYAIKLLGSLDGNSYSVVGSLDVEVVEGENHGGDDDKGDLEPISWRQVSGFVAGEDYEGYLTVSNTYSTEKHVSFDGYLCKLEDGYFIVYAEIGTAEDYIPAKSNAELKYSGNLELITPGEYYLVFVADGSIKASLLVEVSEIEGEISVTRLISEPRDLILGQTSTVEAEIKNTYLTSRNVNLGLYLCILEDQEFWIVHTYGEKNLTLPANDLVTTTFSTVLPASLSWSTYYLVLVDTDNTKIMAQVEANVKYPQSGLEAIGNEDSGCSYFNLKGVEVSSDNLAPGVYIIRKGSKLSKVVIK